MIVYRDMAWFSVKMVCMCVYVCGLTYLHAACTRNIACHRKGREMNGREGKGRMLV